MGSLQIDLKSVAGIVLVGLVVTALGGYLTQRSETLARYDCYVWGFNHAMCRDASGIIDYHCRPHCGLNMVGQIEIVPTAGCPEDITPPAGVEQQDLAAVLARWGDPACELGGGAHPCDEDVTAPDGVEQQDLAAVLARWGDPACE